MFFVRFLHNRSVLLVNPEVLCEEKDYDSVPRKKEKEGVEL